MGDQEVIVEEKTSQAARKNRVMMDEADESGVINCPQQPLERARMTGSRV